MNGERKASELDDYIVFAQRPDARVDVEAWSAHAEAFFSTQLGLAENPRLVDGGAPRTHRVRFVVSPVRARPHDPPHDPPGTRDASARPADDRDRERAEQADGGDTGLALLTKRCPMVWLVHREHDVDRLALRLAMILASALLGPILDVRSAQIFGVKTARAKLEALRSTNP